MVPFPYLMTISASFSCLQGILAFLSAIAKVRTPVVVCADIGSAVQFFVLHSNFSPRFSIHSWSIMKSKPRRQWTQLVSAIKNSWANPTDFCFIGILMSTLPTLLHRSSKWYHMSWDLSVYYLHANCCISPGKLLSFHLPAASDSLAVRGRPHFFHCKVFEKL